MFENYPTKSLSEKNLKNIFCLHYYIFVWITIINDRNIS